MVVAYALNGSTASIVSLTTDEPTSAFYCKKSYSVSGVALQVRFPPPENIQTVFAWSTRLEVIWHATHQHL